MFTGPGSPYRKFSPEFLNRIDSLVVFEPLERPHIRQIARIMEANINKRLKGNRTLQFDLNIDNLFDRSKVIYTTSFAGQSTTYVRARDNNISSPARVTIPGAFSYLAPRSFSFSTKLNF